MSKVAIITLSGQTIQTLVVNSTNTTLDLSSLKNAYYLIVVTDIDGNRQIKKFIKQ